MSSAASITSPATVRWCRQCVLPDTRPNLEFGDDGVCYACRRHGQRPHIDWDAHRRAFIDLIDDVKRVGARYDCVIPVSGGKDSTWQVVKCLELGLHPLAVTWKTPARTAIGAANLANLVALGVDHLDYQINPDVERRFMRKALERRGDPAIPMHMAIFTIPMTVAAWVSAPLVIWGENPAVEYAGDDLARAHEMDDRWLARFGVTQGTSATDWVDDELTLRDMAPYIGPRPDELRAAGVRPIFLGTYFPWTPTETMQVARQHGFRADPNGARTGLYDYADIDDEFISVHHWLKWPKFGFTRLFDNLSLEIRNGRLSRDQALEIIHERGDQKPHDDIAALCRFLQIEISDFEDIAERYRDRRIWRRNADGNWFLPDFVVDDWRW